MIQLVKRKEYRRVSTVYIPTYHEGCARNTCGRHDVMNIEWDYSYYQPWSDNEWLVDEMLAMLDEDVTMQ